MNPDVLQTTGVIATILSVIFALAALWNSRQRRKHMNRMEQERSNAERMRFQPPPSTPKESTVPGVPRESITGPPTRERSEALFRQIRPGGEVEGDPLQEEDKEVYVWE